MSFILRPFGDTDLANAVEVAETGIPQTISGLAAGSYQIGRVAWDDTLHTVSSATGPAVFLLIGQSNMIGRADHDGGSVFGTHVYEWRGSAIVSVDGEDNLSGGNAGEMSSMISFSEAFSAEHPGRDIIFVQAAVGGTGFGGDGWEVGEALYNDAIAQANDALAAAVGAATLEGILWHQGERDAHLNISQEDYESALSALIVGLRNDIALAEAETPVIVGAPGSFFTSGTHAEVRAAQARVRLLANYVAHVDLSDLTSFDGTHFDAASLRTMGTRYHTALATAGTLDAPMFSGIPTVSGASLLGETLTATAAALSTGSPSARTWQWVRSGTVVAGAEGNTYTLSAPDVGQTLAVVQTETNAMGVAVAQSSDTDVITAGAQASAIEAAVNASTNDAAYWATDDLTKLFSDAGITQITGDGDRVRRVLPTFWHGQELHQEHANASFHPFWDATRGLLDNLRSRPELGGSGRAGHSIIGGATPAFGSDVYCAIVMDTPSGSGAFYILADGNGGYIAQGKNGDGNTPHNTWGGTIVMRINGQVFSGTKGDLYTALADGTGKKVVEVYGFDLSGVTNPIYRVGWRTTPWFNHRWGDMLICDNPGATARDAVVAELAAKHGITLA